MWDHKDALIFFAAGNSGPGTGSVGSPSTNKNGVSVGATLRGTSAPDGRFPGRGDGRPGGEPEQRLLERRLVVTYQ